MFRAEREAVLRELANPDPLQCALAAAKGIELALQDLATYPMFIESIAKTEANNAQTPVPAR